MKKIILVSSILIGTLSIAFAQDEPLVITAVSQQDVLVGQNPSTWTPNYLSVDKFQECLYVQNIRGWDGYCLPDNRRDDCPSKSWNELKKMKLIPCQK